MGGRRENLLLDWGMAHNGEPIVVEESYAVSAEDLWEAVTVKERMLGWYFQIPAFEAEVGFEVEFNVECNGTDFLHQWKIIEVDPGKRISYDWKYGGGGRRLGSDLRNHSRGRRAGTSAPDAHRGRDLLAGNP